ALLNGEDSFETEGLANSKGKGDTSRAENVGNSKGKEGSKNEETRYKNAVTCYVSYEKISSDLAWELNLPLPRRYKFVHLANFGMACSAMRYFYGFCNLAVLFKRLAQDAKDDYTLAFDALVRKDERVKVVYLEGYNLKLTNLHKFLHLIDAKVPLVCMLKDPISTYKSFIAHPSANFIHSFNLSFDYEDVLRLYYFAKGKWKEDEPNIENIENIERGGINSNHDLSLSSRIELLNKRSELIFLTMEEINEERAFDTITNLALRLGFKPPKIEDKERFESRIAGGDFYAMARWLYLHNDDIKIMYEEGKQEQRDESSLQKSDAIKVFIGNAPQAPMGYIKANEIFFNEPLSVNALGFFFANEKDIQRLKDNKPLLEASKKYLKGYVLALQKAIARDKAKRFNEEQMLAYIRTSKRVRDYYKQKFDKEFVIIKELVPEIVATWKYYHKFEQMCKELDRV
ncbi:DUF2972 domain-containing protein, partial [Campylobacter troglodytis]|uniref:DUF2972 domain-containing protein n=1 Tax=Campylobacter troglodytis TaxID=654363 RepID=UPI00115AB285